MLELIIVVLIILWLLGYFGPARFPTIPRSGNAVHVLLVIVLILILAILPLLLLLHQQTCHIHYQHSHSEPCYYMTIHQSLSIATRVRHPRNNSIHHLKYCAGAYTQEYY